MSTINQKKTFLRTFYWLKLTQMIDFDVVEKQEKKLCGKHVLNFLFGGAFQHNVSNSDNNHSKAERSNNVINIIPICKRNTKGCNLEVGFYSDDFMFKILTHAKTKQMFNVSNVKMYKKIQKTAKIASTFITNEIQKRFAENLRNGKSIGVIIGYPNHWTCLRLQVIKTYQHKSHILIHFYNSLGKTHQTRKHLLLRFQHNINGKHKNTTQMFQKLKHKLRVKLQDQTYKKRKRICRLILCDYNSLC